jgi:methionine biosynthesis protein MetW
MGVKSYYTSQAELRLTGAYIDGRILKAAQLFQKHLGRAEKLLDIGCGIGAVGLNLQEALNASDVYGVEIEESRVAEARRRGLQVFQADLNQGPLPFEDETFDAIFCGEIIEHVVDPDHLLDEIGRTLRPDGLCVLTTPNLAVWYNRIALLFGWQPFDTSVSFRHEVGRPKLLVTDYGCRDHLRVFAFRALRELLMIHGFRILGVKGCSLSDVIVPSVAWNTRRIRNVIYKILSPLDVLMSRNPAFATRVIFAFRRG